MIEEKATVRTYDDRSHTYGRIWMLSILVLLVGFPLAFSLKYDAFPLLAELQIGQLIPVFLMFYGTAVIETVAYTPLLGTSGMYLSFVTGNITNLKLPCALAALDRAGVKSGTEEGEVISTVAIATSSIVTTLVLALFAVILRPLLPALTAEGSLFAPAFKQVLPCLFGALAASYFMKYWKLGIAPLAVLIIVLLFSGTIPTGTLIPIGVVVALLFTQLLYKKNLI